MNAVRRLALELRLLFRGVAAPVGLVLLVGSGLLALRHGETLIARQREALAASPARQAEEHRRILQHLPPNANAGDQLYYLQFHTVREPSPWAPLAVGQRDVQAYNLKVRILALQGQLYDADLGNPLLSAFGTFDLAFVFVVLGPLLLVALTFNVFSGEVEAGTWSLVRAMPVRAWRVLAVKYALRAALVGLALLALLGLATWRLAIPVDGRWGLVAGATLGYLVFWTLVSAGVAALRRSSEFNLLALLGLWMAWTALGPAALEVAAATRVPLPESLELTVLQRQGYHGAWDEPLPEVMDAFYRRYPEWRGADVPLDRYSNAWYYAMQQRGDDAAADAAARYRASLEARVRWTRGLSWLLPPAAYHQLLTRVAGTDLAGYLAYLDSVAAYHESLKRHFFPVIFDNRPVSAVDWSAAPRHHHRD